MSIGSSGRSAAITDPAAILAKAKVSSGGNPDEVKAYAQAYFDTFFDPELDTEEKRAAAQTAILKAAKPPARAMIAQLFNDAGDSSGTSAKGSASKPPKGMDKAAYDAAKARAQQLKDVDHKDKVEATMTLSTEGVDGDLINHVITEVYS